MLVYWRSVCIKPLFSLFSPFVKGYFQFEDSINFSDWFNLKMMEILRFFKDKANVVRFTPSTPISSIVSTALPSLHLSALSRDQIRTPLSLTTGVL